MPASRRRKHPSRPGDSRPHHPETTENQAHGSSSKVAAPEAQKTTAAAQRCRIDAAIESCQCTQPCHMRKPHIPAALDLCQEKALNKAADFQAVRTANVHVDSECPDVSLFRFVAGKDCLPDKARVASQ